MPVLRRNYFPWSMTSCVFLPLGKCRRNCPVRHFRQRHSCTKRISGFLACRMNDGTLIENARKKKSLRRGGNRKRVELDESILVTPQDIGPDDLLAFNEALEKPAQKDRAKADLIKLLVFAGLTSKQAAQILGISPSKACEDLAYARAWLCLEINKGEPDSLR